MASLPGWDQAAAAIQAWGRAAAVAGLHAVGKALVREVRARIDTPGAGVPSAPGEPPRLQTGDLWQSIAYEVDPVALRVYVIADTPYAVFLEYGTGRMAPRPFLRVGVITVATTVAAARVGVLFGAPRPHAPPEVL